MTEASFDFDRMFAASDDPWAFRTRWYEQRKRAVTLAALPQSRYGAGFEPGCANGELSADLALRCDDLLVCDVSAAAASLARQRLADLPNVEVRQAALPNDWPDRRFDLIVVSELGYFLDQQALYGLIDRCMQSLNPGGTLLACHWRHAFAGATLPGDAVQAAFGARTGLPRLVHHEEADFLLDVWSADARSVAKREGIE